MPYFSPKTNAWYFKYYIQRYCDKDLCHTKNGYAEAYICHCGNQDICFTQKSPKQRDHVCNICHNKHFYPIDSIDNEILNVNIELKRESGLLFHKIL